MRAIPTLREKTGGAIDFRPLDELALPAHVQCDEGNRREILTAR